MPCPAKISHTTLILGMYHVSVFMKVAMAANANQTDAMVKKGGQRVVLCTIPSSPFLCPVLGRRNLALRSDLVILGFATLAEFFFFFFSSSLFLCLASLLRSVLESIACPCSPCFAIHHTR